MAKKLSKLQSAKAKAEGLSKLIGKRLTLYLTEGVWTLKSVRPGMGWVNMMVYNQAGEEKAITEHHIKSFIELKDNEAL